MDGVKLIQAAVARADLALCVAGFWLRSLLPGLITGVALWRIIAREERRR